MKKYKIPTNTTQIKEIDGILYAEIRELIKIDNDWEVIPSIKRLEEIND